MSRTWIIANNTVRQTIRQRLFLNILVFGIGMVIFAMVVSNITFGYPDRVVRSIGLSGVNIATNLLALLVGVSLVHGEIDKKTLFVVLTRPVPRWTYVVGRYLGLVIALLGVVAGFGLVFFAMLLYVNGTPSYQDIVALGMSFVEACVLGGFAVVLSSFSSPSLSAGIGLGFWIACSSTDDLVKLTAQADAGVAGLAQGVAYVLPAFARFNFREAAAYADPVALSSVASAAGYGLIYAVGFVLLASAVLSRREMV